MMVAWGWLIVAFFFGFTGGDFQIYSTVHYMLWAAGFLLWLDLAVLLLYLKEVD